MLHQLEKVEGKYTLVAQANASFPSDNEGGEQGSARDLRTSAEYGTSTSHIMNVPHIGSGVN